MNEYSKVSELKGIGEKTEKLFQKLNIYTIGDLLRYYPRSYEIYEESIPIETAEEGKVVTITGNIYGKVQVAATKSLQITTAYIKDLTGTIKVIWFRMPFLRNTLKSGSVITLRGRIVNKKGKLQMEHPEIFYPSISYDVKLNTMQPVLIEQVVRLGKFGIVLFLHRVESARLCREVDNEHELTTVLLFDVFGNESLAFGIKVALKRAGYFVILLGAENLVRLVERNARYSHVNINNVAPEMLVILVVKILLNVADNVFEERFFNVHNVVVRVDKRNLYVNARELGVVSARKRRVGAKILANLESTVKASHHAHLLV